MKGKQKKRTKALFNQGARVMTPDGPGRTIGTNMRKNTNGGPGVRQYIVELDDGRKRHYGTNEVTT
jgi:hypothetical protein